MLKWTDAQKMMIASVRAFKRREKMNIIITNRIKEDGGIKLNILAVWKSSCIMI
jgi:hypothetical protein